MERCAAPRTVPSICLISVAAIIALPCTAFSQQGTGFAATAGQYLRRNEEREVQGDAGVATDLAAQNQGVEKTASGRAFSPITPIMLSSLENNLLVSRESSGSNRHIDVTLKVTPYGRGKDVEIIGVTDSVNRADKRKLTRLITENTFRPITTDGQFAYNTPIVLRYYLPQEKQD